MVLSVIWDLIANFKIDVNTFYYTYSTIAQTLAAAFAFVGAFVLFRLQHLNKILNSITDKMIETLQNFRAEIVEFKECEDWDDMIPGFKKSLLLKELSLNDQKEKKEEEINDFVDKNKSVIKFKHTLEGRKKLIKDFKEAAGWLTITIITSLILLPLSHYFENSLGFGIATILVICFSIYCLWLCQDLIVRSIDGKASKDEGAMK